MLLRRLPTARLTGDRGRYSGPPRRKKQSYGWRGEVLSVIGFNFLGDGLRDVLDPRMKGR